MMPGETVREVWRVRFVDSERLRQLLPPPAQAGGEKGGAGMSSPSTVAQTRSRIDRMLLSAARLPHGTRGRYIASRCRCMLCRAANSRYQTHRDALRRGGEAPDRLTPAVTAREYILRLGRQGIGYKTVAETASVARSSVAKIVSGERAQIRSSTETRILAVDSSCRADHACVPGGPTWKLIRRLLKRGYSKAQLAKWLGYRTPALQLNRNRVTVLNAAKIKRMYRAVEDGLLARPA